MTTNNLVNYNNKNDITICDCECHHMNPRIKEAIPCCTSCPECGQKIKTGMLERHLENCRKQIHKEVNINLRK